MSRKEEVLQAREPQGKEIRKEKGKKSPFLPFKLTPGYSKKLL